jgi:hypothetical protein
MTFLIFISTQSLLILLHVVIAKNRFYIFYNLTKIFVYFHVTHLSFSVHILANMCSILKGFMLFYMQDTSALDSHLVQLVM